jgi:hypothetical protein
MPPLHWHDLGFRPPVPPPCRFAWPFVRRLGYPRLWAGCQVPGPVIIGFFIPIYCNHKYHPTQAKTNKGMASCIHLADGRRLPGGPRATSCVLRALLYCTSLLPDLPLRPPAFPPLALSLASPSFTAWLPRPSVLPLEFPLIPLYRGRLLVILV